MNLKPTFTLRIDKLEVEGLPVEAVLAQLAALKADLESQGCQVEITVNGEELPTLAAGPVPEQWTAHR